MELIDTHSHLYLPEFDEDRASVHARGLAAGITNVLLPAIDQDSHHLLHQLSDSAPAYYLPMMGVHPCSIKANWQEELQIAKQFLDSGRKYYAVGEIGLDYYWDKTFVQEQQGALREQLRWAFERSLPVAIHTRDAMDDCIEIVAEMRAELNGEMSDQQLRGVFHCFSGTLEQAQKIIDLGFYLGIGGVSTYKNGGLDKVLPGVGITSVVLETDAPYLSPVPHRGKRNETAYIGVIAERVALLCGVSPSAVAETSSLNARQLFNI